MMRSLLLAVTVLGLCGAGLAQAGDYREDSCPDRNGTAFIVDTPAKAATLANGFSRPSCNLILRTSIDPGDIVSAAFRIGAKSIAVEGAEIANPLTDSRITLLAYAGDIVISNSRLLARRDVWIECREPATCSITVQQGSKLRAGRSIRTLARGTVTIEDTRLVSAEVDLLESAR